MQTKVTFSRRKIILSIISFSCSIILLICAIVGPILIRNYINDYVKSLLEIKDVNSQGYQRWVTNTHSDSAKEYWLYYIFNITNPDEILVGKDAILQEVGPYSYIKSFINFNCSWSDDRSEITYYQWEWFNFDPITSGEGLNPDNDTFYTVNLGLAALLSQLESDSENLKNKWWEDLLVSTLLSGSNSSYFEKKTPHQIIWGNDSDVLLFLQSLGVPVPKTKIEIQTNITSIEECINRTKPNTINTGVNDISQIYQYIKWQNMSKLAYWGSDEANEIIGTDASQFSPGIQSNDVKLTFADSLFRSLTLRTNSSTKVKNIKLQVFEADLVIDFSNASQYPANAAFYSFGPSGVLNLTSPEQAPVFVSLPHFLYADPFYFNGIKGLNPDPVKHNTFINVEPITGITMETHNRVQVNIKLSQIFLFYPDVKPLYMPVLWLEKFEELTDDQASTFRDKVYLALDFQSAVRWAGFGLAFLLLIPPIVLLVVYLKQYSVTHGYRRLVLGEADINS